MNAASCSRAWFTILSLTFLAPAVSGAVIGIDLGARFLKVRAASASVNLQCIEPCRSELSAEDWPVSFPWILCLNCSCAIVG